MTTVIWRVRNMSEYYLGWLSEGGIVDTDGDLIGIGDVEFNELEDVELYGPEDDAPYDGDFIIFRAVDGALGVGEVWDGEVSGVPLSDMTHWGHIDAYRF